VFRNAMLIVIAGSQRLHRRLLHRLLLIEQVFSLDGLGYLSYDSLIQRDYPLCSPIYIFALIGPW
jgi:microcin C transport system permease protein